ncbi:unnamed protein product [Eruca vesicaria subsp. sativa]|uniref:Uncharacterized protein n=1 Tax=Eruca vesicaria subsp. sativa TaxID=29727 RepID=A0ABC8JZ98_ERUVS|nr:unnamed protein product [Eruca vesicaria subsp. sativa]
MRFSRFNRKSLSHCTSENAFLVYKRCNYNFTKYIGDSKEINTMLPFNETGHFSQTLMTDSNEESGSSMKENIGPEDDENAEISPLLGCDIRKGQNNMRTIHLGMAKVSITSHYLMRTQTEYT